MSVAARELFKLDKPGKDGVPLRSHLEQLERVTGNRPDGLNVTEFPPAAGHLLVWFWELNSTRTSNGFGANPISYTEISAWAMLTSHVLRPEEVRLLRVLDNAFLSVMNERGTNG